MNSCVNIKILNILIHFEFSVIDMHHNEDHNDFICFIISLKNANMYMRKNISLHILINYMKLQKSFLFMNFIL